MCDARYSPSKSLPPFSSARSIVIALRLGLAAHPTPANCFPSFVCRRRPLNDGRAFLGKSDAYPYVILPEPMDWTR